MKTNLFSPADIKTQIEECASLESQAQPSITQSPARLAQKPNKLAQHITACLSAGHKHIDFVSAGDLSLHNLIQGLCFYFDKPAELWLSTWAVKEAAARTIVQLIDSKHITAVRAVFDYRIQSVDAKTYHLLKRHLTQSALTKNHAKVIVLDFITDQITIVTSANLSNNPRIEAGFVSANQLTSDFHMGWMKKVLSGQRVV